MMGDELTGPRGTSLTVNPEVVLPLLFSSGIDGDTSVPAGIADQSAAEGQHPAARQHLPHKYSKGMFKFSCILLKSQIHKISTSYA